MSGWLANAYAECTTLQALTANQIREYLISLEARGLAGATQHSAARAVRAFLNWCVREELLDISPMRSVRMPRVESTILEALTERDVKRLLKTCDNHRDIAIVLVLLDTGCRASEFVALDIGDVDQITGEVRIRQGKGRKDRLTYIGSRTRRALGKYLATRPYYAASDPLWIPAKDNTERLSVWGLQQLLRRLGKAAGVAHCNPHAFRRTFALWSLRSGMSIYALQRLMGHSDISMLRRYLPLVEQDLAEAHARHGAVDSWLR